MEPLAVGSFFVFFGYMGFNALAYYENRSFASGNLGKKIFNDKLTIVEDPFALPYPVMPFDFEGMPRQRVVLVENGVLKNLVTDKKTAKLTGLKYTGHSLFEPNAVGAVPASLCIEGGKKSLKEIISETEYGILATEFHYTNPLKPKTLEITGMTRNGTYLIENGKIKKAVKNMRFTQSMVDAMNNIIDISSEREAYPEWGQVMLIPAIKVSNFNFSSTTEF
ncbi:MAG: TldD/PmbA family protein [Elusimicrobiota bacterium]